MSAASGMAVTHAGHMLPQNGSSAAGSASGTANGNSAYVNANVSGFSTPIYRPTSDIGVTVVMFHAGEPGAKDAFDAAEVLRRANN